MTKKNTITVNGNLGITRTFSDALATPTDYWISNFKLSATISVTSQASTSPLIGCDLLTLIMPDTAKTLVFRFLIIILVH